jgi:2-polyprenyl-6-methoxyphenol hydroxylase-like FAD-dependent oxidoreductase
LWESIHYPSWANYFKTALGIKEIERLARVPMISGTTMESDPSQGGPARDLFKGIVPSLFRVTAGSFPAFEASNGRKIQTAYPPGDRSSCYERKTMKPGKVIIVGGSVGGMFAGVLLERDGWDVAMYERSFGGLAGKGAGLVPQSEVGAVLGEIGRRDVLDSGVVARERIFLDRNGDVVQTIRTAQSQISWDLLFSAFRSCVSDARYKRGRAIARVSTGNDRATVNFDDGTSDSSDLVIGADGIGSVVREAVAPGTSPQYAGYAAFRGLAPESYLPVASAPLLSERFTFYNGHRTQFLGYLVAGADGSTLPGARRYNWVWYRPMSQTQLDAALTSDAGERRVYSAPPFGLSLATRQNLAESARRELPSVLAEVVTQEAAPFLQAIFDYEAPTLRHGRLVLLGDAAFVVRPHTAMGVSKAAGDAMALRDVLRSAATIEEALERYADQRHQVGSAIARYGRRLGESFMETY